MSDQSEEGELRQDAGRGGPRYSRRRFLVARRRARRRPRRRSSSCYAAWPAAGPRRGGVAEMFGPFPVRSVEDVPDSPGRRSGCSRSTGSSRSRCTWIDTAWATLPRARARPSTSTASRAGRSTTCAGAASRPARCSTRARRPPEGTLRRRSTPTAATYVDSLPLELVTRPADACSPTRSNGEPLPRRARRPATARRPRPARLQERQVGERLEVTDRPVRRATGSSAAIRATRPSEQCTAVGAALGGLTRRQHGPRTRGPRETAAGSARASWAGSSSRRRACATMSPSSSGGRG